MCNNSCNNYHKNHKIIPKNNINLTHNINNHPSHLPPHPTISTKIYRTQPPNT